MIGNYDVTKLHYEGPGAVPGATGSGYGYSVRTEGFSLSNLLLLPQWQQQRQHRLGIPHYESICTMSPISHNDIHATHESRIVALTLLLMK